MHLALHASQAPQPADQKETEHPYHNNATDRTEDQNHVRWVILLLGLCGQDDLRSRPEGVLLVWKSSKLIPELVAHGAFWQ
jgi:hypothetical protein